MCITGHLRKGAPSRPSIADFPTSDASCFIAPMNAFRFTSIALPLLFLSAACFYSRDSAFEGLQAGDVTAIAQGIRPQTQGVAPLDAQVTVLHSTMVRHAGADGRVVLHNLPSGKHQLQLSWPAGNMPALLARVPVGIDERNHTRPSVDLGHVTLGLPARLLGLVAAGPGVDAGSVVHATISLDD